MAFLLELVALLVGLATRPLVLVAVSCQFGLRSISIVIQTWIELLRTALCLHLVILWRPIIWMIAVLSLPVRAFTALYRERLLEMQLHQMRIELENALWDRKDLEERLRIAIREHDMMEVMLMELEDENDEAIAKIELLDGEVHDLKDEIQRLNEVEGKSLWDKGIQDDAVRGSTNTKNSENLRASLPSCIENTTHVMSPEDFWERERNDLVNTQSKIQRPTPPFNTYTNTILKDDNILAKLREPAVSQSLFSAILSLVVGIIVWEAKDPCMPLLVALFTVVAISLSSVIKFFSTIEHKPASDAVALLGFNWFILGTLTYPTFPRFARVSTPLALSFLKRIFKWLTS